MTVENQPVILPEELKAAIACLDLSLESELALYRSRQKQESLALAVLSSSALEIAALQSSESELQEFRPDLEKEALGALSHTNDDAESGIASEGAQDTTTLLETEDEIETLPESYSAELTAEPEAFDQFLDPSIEDYLESSEALLKHLDDPVESEIPPVEKGEPPAKRSWVVVLGIPLLILGLLALAGFLGVLALRWFSLKPVSVPTPQPLVPSPMSPSPLPSSAIAPPGGIPSNAAMNPAVAPTAAPTALINPSAARYIVLATGGQETLQAARQLVPDAFIAVVDGQSRVQLADLDSLQQAQQMVNELKNQGFPALIVAQN